MEQYPSVSYRQTSPLLVYPESEDSMWNFHLVSVKTEAEPVTTIKKSSIKTLSVGLTGNSTVK